MAVVHGNVKDKEIIKSYLAETKTLLVYETMDKNNGKFAITEYEKIKANKNLSLIKINIKTGRKHQIRVQLSNKGYDIVGDKKYGKSKFDPLRRLCLCANFLEIIHPVTNKKISFNLDIPKMFINLLGDIND